MNDLNIISLEELLRRYGRYNGGDFTELEIERLRLYYQLVLKWNPRLHLTTIVEPSQFFQRHLLESDFAASLLLSSIDQIWDLGTGLGIPGVPIAILHNNLQVNLVEAKRQKAYFLEEVISSLNLTNVVVVNRRIESLANLPQNSCLTARAVEKMEALVPLMVEIGRDCGQMLFLGSGELESLLQKILPQSIQIRSYQILQSDKRKVISVIRST